jgi:hypothetical protein
VNHSHYLHLDRANSRKRGAKRKAAVDAALAARGVLSEALTHPSRCPDLAEPSKLLRADAQTERNPLPED